MDSTDTDGVNLQEVRNKYHVATSIYIALFICNSEQLTADGCFKALCNL